MSEKLIWPTVVKKQFLLVQSEITSDDLDDYAKCVESEVLQSVIDVLNQEIKWCEDNPGKIYEKGFTAGVRQAKNLVSDLTNQTPEHE